MSAHGTPENIIGYATSLLDTLVYWPSEIIDQSVAPSVALS